ncbi:Nse4 C-terminal-domain-containing protein [Calycina marina]|uniref:Non-structural maintenance of chromosomes element 4 n=1 Tax=Calycina marina TaxID=1763456 RepID=A0A9P7Z2N3_9HELO|nr:Nse4 C-terminal-domain-containing protein [Calycina marina]
MNSRKMSSSALPFEDDLYDASSASPRRKTINQRASPTPPASSSDKENRTIRPQDKGKGQTPMASISRTSTSAAGAQFKRKRTEEVPDRNTRRRTIEVNEEEDARDADTYDPDQPIEERRAMRNDYRELNRNLNENRSDFLAAESTGLKDILTASNSLSKKVKQTSDATIDSRLLVSTADLSYKRAVALVSGDISQSMDVEEFISRSKAYMRQGGVPNIATQSSTQRRRRPSDEEEDEEDGDTLNWEYLGRNACLPFNSRPAISGFLLGPLSVEKRARKVAVRRAALKQSAVHESRPEVLKAGDIERNENENLTVLCRQIIERLKKMTRDAVQRVEDEVETIQGDVSDDQAQDIMTKYHVSDFSGLAYFPFVINPKSFGQTIENMFYVSFLIRDGKLAIQEGNDAMPYLVIMNGGEEPENDGDPAKQQAVMSLDMEQWEELIELFGIMEPMIKHRDEAVHTSNAKGWYA